MVRDGRDVVASFKGRFKSQPQYGLKYGAKRWLSDTRETLRWADHKQVLLVRYESLVRNTSATLRSIFAFLDEDYDEAQILSFYTNLAAVNGVRGDAVAQKQGRAVDHEELRALQMARPLYDGSGRWAEAAPRGLTADEKVYVKDECQELLRQLDYVADDSWAQLQLKEE